MYFKNPNILFALFALIIPIIVHLFYLRRFQKTYFTNVKFLKELISKTRKSSKLKKWIILLTRMLALACIVIAFAEPSLKKIELNNKKETVFYIDNSISNKEKGEKGEMLKVNIQNLINNYPKDEKINIITNDYVFKNKTIKNIKKELINLKYSNKQLGFKLIALKAKKLFSSKNNDKRLICISDFQKNTSIDSSYFDPKIKTTLIQNLPVSKSNISIDSAFFSNNSNNETDLNVVVKKQFSAIESTPISIYNNDTLISKTSVELSKKTNTKLFNLPSKKELNLKISIEDNNGVTDNYFYATKRKNKKINILAIGSKNNNLFLSKIFTNDEFNFTQKGILDINYSAFQKQDLIIINELQKLSIALTENLIVFTKNGGKIICIPSSDLNKKSYAKIIDNYKENYNESRLTKIHFSHPIYKNVFKKNITNFDFPFFKTHYKLKGYETTLLSFENENPFLVYTDNKYIFAAPLNKKNSNFKLSPLIVPTFYNIARSTLKNNIPYYIIGEENEISFEIKMKKDEIITLSKNDIDYIPIQQVKKNKVIIKTKEKPSEAGIYKLKLKNNNKNKYIAYNYSNSESIREYSNLNKLKSKHIDISNSLSDSLVKINSASEIGSLWKWFIIFAILFLIVELLILKYYK